MKFITQKSILFNYFLFTISILVLLPLSCKKDKGLTEPLVSVKPNNLYIYASIEDIISFNIKVDTDVSLNRFVITSKLDNSFQVTELDSTLSNLDAFNMTYEYQVPSNATDKSIIFNFIAYNVEGNSGTAVKRVVVYPLSPVVPRLLAETTGHQIYSHNSQNPDAYNLETGSPEFSLLADSTDRDIQDNPTNDTTQTISKSWISPAGGKLMKFNDYDYANATDSSLISAYEAGIKLDQISDIQQGDIILTKLGSISDTTNYAVIKIVSIVDMDSTKNDFYLFNLKK